MCDSEFIVRVRSLKKYFKVGKHGSLKAVDDVSLDIRRGETLSLVGESGCGKSTLGRTIIGAYAPTSGSVSFDGEDLTAMSPRQRKRFALKAQMIFQDPYSALNPRMIVGDIVAQGLDIHQLCRGEARDRRIAELLTMVGLSPNAADRFPHEFSGGQLQRVGIARALAVNPEFLVCDEPISALDVSIQAQIVNLLRKLKEMKLTNLFIAHDLNMVRYISDRTAVMYLGRVVELGESDAVSRSPLHPYTRALISAVPQINGGETENTPALLEGEIPSPIHPPEGCAFFGRCPHAAKVCEKTRPPLMETEAGRYTACLMLGGSQDSYGG